MSTLLAEGRPTAGQSAAMRSRLYQLLANIFAFPDQALFAALRDDTIAHSLELVVAALPYQFLPGQTVELGSAGETYADFEAEYIRLFDVGAAGPPCPLYGGVYADDRMKTMEDATRFYNFFGLRLSPQLRELPDHITTELEFFHYLTYREAEAHRHELDAASLRRAERDFLARHLCSWLPSLQRRLARQQTFTVFPALVGFAAAFVGADRTYVSSLVQ